MINLVACCLNIYAGVFFPSIFYDMMRRGTMSQIFYLGPGFCFMLLRKLCIRSNPTKWTHLGAQRGPEGENLSF